MELFIAIIIGLLVAVLLHGRSGVRRHDASVLTARNSKPAMLPDSPPGNWMTDPGYFWMPGNIYYQSSDNNAPSQVSAISAISDPEPDQDNWHTDPAYAYLPGNIFYRDDNITSGTAADSNCSSGCMINDTLHQHTISPSCCLTEASWITDPVCSYLSGNIFHNDAISSSTGSTADEDIASYPDTNGFDDSWSSISSFSDDDTWSLSSSDDSWSGSSSFDDD